MRITNISARGWRFRRLWMWLMPVLALFSGPLGTAGAAAVSCYGNDFAQTRPGPSGEFLTIRKGLIEGSRAPVAVQSVTTFLSPGDDARIVFRAPASPSDKSPRFRIFETNGVEQKTFETRRELPVLAAGRVPADLPVSGFLPDDSTLIRFQLPDRVFPLWAHRSFVVIQCVDGAVTEWGVLRARVSNAPVTIAICGIILLLAYYLAMRSVWLFHNEQHPLAKKYPAYEVRRQMTRLDFFNPIHLMADAFHRGSVQKFQVVLFSFLVGGLLLSLVLRNGVLIALSSTVVGLLGIVGAGAAMGQSTATFRNRMSFDNWTWLVTKKVLPINEAAGAAPRWRDLVTTNREFDIYKLQAVIFSVAVALALVTAGASSLSSFDVPPTLLGILALSQGIFVAGLLVRPPSVDELDKALTDLRKAEESARSAVAYDVDVDTSGNLPQPLTPPSPLRSFSERKAKAKRALQRYKEMADRVEVMIESTLETEIERRRLDPDLGEGRRILGPEGAPRGSFFSTDPNNDEFEVASLSVWSGAVIDAIQMTYRHRLNPAATIDFKFGGAGGGLNQLVLAPGEFITRVEGGVGQFVIWMTVYTNRDRRMRWGGPAADRQFEFQCDHGEEVIVFEGRSDDYVYALGAVVRNRL